MDYAGYTVFAVLFALYLATRRHRQISARGNKVSPTNTWLTVVASVGITVLALAILYAAMVTDHLWAGIGAFAVMMIGGQIAAARAIARRWPVEVPRENPATREPMPASQAATPESGVSSLHGRTSTTGATATDARSTVKILAICVGLTVVLFLLIDVYFELPAAHRAVPARQAIPPNIIWACPERRDCNESNATFSSWPAETIQPGKSGEKIPIYEGTKLLEDLNSDDPANHVQKECWDTSLHSIACKDNPDLAALSYRNTGNRPVTIAHAWEQL
ncbi:MAG TPA: hypothetical protein VMU01_10230, partial [Rhizomicrobium sp.]|nr:hypothetical protein [Rhizomicrobium sp.]